MRTCMTFLSLIALRNKTLAHTFLPSLDNAEWPSLSKKIAEIQKYCYHGNLTSQRPQNSPIMQFVTKSTQSYF